MSFDDLSWRAPDKRQVIVQKLANVLPPKHNPIDVENSIFQEAKSQHDYINMIGKILMSIQAKGREQQQQWQPGMEIYAGMEWGNNSPTKPAYLEQVPSCSSYSIPPPPTNTPLNLESPTGHSPMPETNTAVMLKLQELQPYLPLLARMIDKIRDSPKYAKELTKLNSLYSVIHNKNLKVPLPILERCHHALRKLFDEDTPLASKL
jgi:hypothetical protein